MNKLDLAVRRRVYHSAVSGFVAPLTTDGASVDEDVNVGLALANELVDHVQRTGQRATLYDVVGQLDPKADGGFVRVGFYSRIIELAVAASA